MISIIIPVYNGVPWLSEAINSALIQRPICDIIVVNDGSIDNSLEIAKRYPVRIINQVNKGLANARNTGLMNSQSDYVLFLDADDILLPRAIEELSTYILGTPDVIAPSFKEFGLSNREVILMPNPTLKDFKVGNRIGYCAAIRRSTLLEIGGYSPKMIWGYEDYHLWFNLLTRGKKIVTIPEVLWLYRTKEESMITEARKHHEELMAQIKKDFPNEFR